MHFNNRSIAALLVILALAAAAAVGAVRVSKDERQIAELQSSLAAQRQEGVKRDSELAAMRRSREEVRKEHAATIKSFSSRQDELKEAVDAFAKQAGACEALRKKLNIPGYTS